LSRPFHCPVQVLTGRPYTEAITDLLAGKRWALATSAGWTRRGAVDAFRRTVGEPEAVIDAIPPNPRVADVRSLTELLPEVDTVVALGGGSVIDAAKGLVGLQALKGDSAALMAHLRDGADLPEKFHPATIIAVPTTSGTGSEVTPWATIWGDDNVKFSFNHPTLYPSHAVLDPTLCASMPEDVTLSSGLDALSHAMESIWNNNNTPVSDELASRAIQTLRMSLRNAVENPQDIRLRSEIQVAALLSGLAMGTTQTALAHSISYPFTAHFGMPHGFACSFTLSEVARYNIAEDADRLTPIAVGMRCNVDEIPDALDKWFADLDVGRHVLSYVSPDVTDQLGDNLITRARAANNLRSIDGAKAREIARTALERF
jgi:alcohol dehydrogenase